LGLQLVPGAKQRALLKRGTGVTLKQHFVLGVGTHTCGVERTFGQRDELLQPIKLTGKEIRIGSKDGERKEHPTPQSNFITCHTCSLKPPPCAVSACKGVKLMNFTTRVV